jgi:hypothetical protein
MTMTADRTTTRLSPGDAQGTLLEMAAVIRAVFGVRLGTSRPAPDTVTAEVEAPQEPVVATSTSSSLGAPASIPMPGLPTGALQQETAVVPEAPAPYAGTVPSLRVVPDPATPSEHVHSDDRHAVLREVAFLDD